MTDNFDKRRFGRGTVNDNLARAVAAEALTLLEDGAYAAPPPAPSVAYLHVKPLERRSCRFLNAFLFNHAYDRSAVPYGCRSCYKVKAVPTNLRGLVALRGLLEDAPYPSKCGIDLYNPHSRDIYAGFLYLDGLDLARAAWRDMRLRIDAHPDLGATVTLTIKRGCSDFEAACGQSDRWTFPEGMAELEDRLHACYRPLPMIPRDYRLSRMRSMVAWLQLAYSLKDDTYLDFTGGKPLHRPTLTYPVDEPQS